MRWCVACPENQIRIWYFALCCLHGSFECPERYITTSPCAPIVRFFAVFNTIGNFAAAEGLSTFRICILFIVLIDMDIRDMKNFQRFSISFCWKLITVVISLNYFSYFFTKLKWIWGTTYLWRKTNVFPLVYFENVIVWKTFIDAHMA